MEGFIVSLLGFIRAFFATIKDVALRPGRFARNISDDHGEYLKPFSFLTLATFSSVTITRYALIAVGIAVSVSLRGCSGETYVPKEPPTLKEILQLPSVETLIYVALPAVLLIIIIGRVIDWLLLRPGADRRHSIALIFLFVAGIQQLVVIPVLFGFYLAANQWDKVLNGWILIGAVGIAILLPAFSFFRIGRTLNPPLAFRVTTPWRRNLLFAVVAGLSVSLSLAAIGGMGYWLARKEIEAAAIDVPMIAVAYIEQVAEAPPGRPRFSVLLKNNGKTDLWVRSKLLMEFPSEKPEGMRYECVLVGPELRAGLVKLPKGEVVPSFIEVQKRVDQEQGESPTHFFLLAFQAMDLEGKESSIFSQIRSSDGRAAEEIVRKVQGPAEKGHDD
ncbi:MAG: hypothetical protein ABR611_12645 [Chthoniobacterales bacterium]